MPTGHDDRPVNNVAPRQKVIIHYMFGSELMTYEIESLSRFDATSWVERTLPHNKGFWIRSRSTSAQQFIPFPAIHRIDLPPEMR